jgi:RNA polymerase-binding transcription factor DksA
MKPTATTPDSFAAFTSALHQRREALRRELGDAQPSADPDRDPEQVHDAKDDAERQQIDTVRSAEIARDWQELKRVEGAIQRLAAGTFGQCTDCGSRIDRRRLQAEPASARCLACQTRAEGAAR